MRRDPAEVLRVLLAAADAVGAAVRAVTDWGLSGMREGQYRADLVADAAALGVLRDAGFGVLSEESGLDVGGRSPLVIVDPLDGSTNAGRAVPWYATSLCALDDEGPLVAVVVDQARGTRFHAVRGGGAFRDGAPIRASGCERLDEALVGLNGWPSRHLGWGQYRALGAAALDLCMVAAGVLDGYVDCTRDSHGVWDYAAAVLICAEAGAPVADLDGRALVVAEHGTRRIPVAAATGALHAQLVAARRSLDRPGGQG